LTEDDESWLRRDKETDRQTDRQTERDADTEIKEERQKEIITKGCLHCSSRRTTNLSLGEKDVETDINRQLDRLSQKDRQITS
jgi:hypothetical protein